MSIRAQQKECGQLFHIQNISNQRKNFLNDKTLKPLGHNGFEILKRQKRPVLSPLLGSNKKK